MTLTPGGATERLWCQACGTVTPDQLCDCNRWGKDHEMFREPNFVNYADAMQEEAARANSKLEAYRKALGDEIKIIEERYGGRRKFLENSLHGDAMQWRRLTNVQALAAGGSA